MGLWREGSQMGKKAPLRKQRKAARKSKAQERQAAEQAAKMPLRVYSGPEIRINGSEIEREL